MKKFTTVGLSLLLVLTLFVGMVQINSAGAPSINISDTTGLPGETVTVTATVNNNPGFNSGSLLIVYDDNALKLKSATLGSSFSSFVPTYSGLPYITFYGANDVSKDDVLLNMEFEILASSGTYAVTLEYKEGDIANLNEEDVNFQIISGSISVKEASIPKITLDNVSGNTGETVTMTASVSGNPGFNSASFLIKYDNTALQLKSASLGESFGTFIPTYSGLPYIPFYGATDISTNGVLLNLEFNILASSGVYEVTLEYEEGSVANYNEEDVNFTIIAGSVIVVNSTNSYSVTWDWKEDFDSASATFVNASDETDSVVVKDEDILRVLEAPVVGEYEYSYTYIAEVIGPDGNTYSDTKTKTGIFGGWYKDAALTEYYESSPADQTAAYAKLVDPDVLSIQFQIKQGTTTDDESTVIRILTTVDSLNYKKVGFVVSYTKSSEGTSKVFETETVYKKITGIDGIDAVEYAPTEFSSESIRFCAFNLTVQNELFDTKVTYTPFWETLDGTIVYGIPGAVTLINHITG